MYKTEIEMHEEVHGKECSCLMAFVPPTAFCTDQDFGITQYFCGCEWGNTPCMGTPFFCSIHRVAQGTPVNKNPSLEQRLQMKRRLKDLGYTDVSVKLLKDFIEQPWVYDKETYK